MDHRPARRGLRAAADGRRALLAGGGVGIPPLAAWSRVLDAHDVAAGGAARLPRRRSTPRARALLDASAGVRSPPTTARSATTASSPTCSPPSSTTTTHAVVYACGPPGMLEAVRALCDARGVPAQLALEAGMACGFGACFGCVVAVRDGGYVRVCVDGPVLDAARLEAVPAH